MLDLGACGVCVCVVGAAPIPVGGGEHAQGVLQEHHGRQGHGPQLEEADLQSDCPARRLCARVLQVAGLPRTAGVG